MRRASYASDWHPLGFKSSDQNQKKDPKSGKPTADQKTNKPKDFLDYRYREQMSSVICPQCDIAIRKECIHTHIYKEHPHFIFTDTFGIKLDSKGNVTSSGTLMLRKFLRALDGEPIAYDIGSSESDAKGECKEMYMDMASGAYSKETTAQTHITSHPDKHIDRWITCITESLTSRPIMKLLVEYLLKRPDRVILDSSIITKKDEQIAALTEELKVQKQRNFELEQKLLKANEPIDKRLAELRVERSHYDRIEIDRLNSELRSLQDKIDELRTINRTYSEAEYKAFLDTDNLLEREKKKWTKEIERAEKKIKTEYEKKAEADKKRIKDLKAQVKKLEYEIYLGKSDSDSDSEPDYKKKGTKKAAGGAGRSRSGSDSD